MPIENETVMQFLGEIRQDIKDLRAEFKDELQRTRHDIRDEMGARVVLGEQRLLKHEDETKHSFEKQERRVSALEQFRYSLHVLTAGAATVASWFGFKITGGS